MRTRFATFVFVLFLMSELVGADAIVIEKLSFQFDEHGRARAIGVLKNTSQYLIALPVLEVTFVTKEQPNAVAMQRLVLSASLKGGESRPFHSGVFSSSRPVLLPSGDVAFERISEIRASRIHPGSMMRASPDWNLRLAGRDGVSFDAPVLMFEGGTWRGVKGKLVAPLGSKIRTAEFAAAYFDTNGELVDVQTFTVQRRDGQCIALFPYQFETGAGFDDLKIARVSVECLCNHVIACE